ncbi:lipopolysaccharide-modifying protein [Xylaria acuta]|nr:lipopolysaccharide-modifying protein [Xylaria acuta]
MLLVARARLKYLVITCVVTLPVLYIYFISYQALPDALSGILGSGASPKGRPGSGGGGTRHATPPPAKVNDGHPISGLIEDAYTRFSRLLGRRSWSLAHAASRYRELRGRHPPPGFDKWFEAAQNHDAIVVEEFFDRIHHDINPFWGADPHEMRRRARALPHAIRVRNGKIAHPADDDGPDPPRKDRLQLWEALVRDMLPHLPDLDIPLNLLDEPRVLVPWEEITSLVAAERASRRVFPPHEAVPETTGFEDVDTTPPLPFDPQWIDDRHRYWAYVSAACAPDSAGREAEPLDASTPIDEIFPPDARTLPHMTEGGFVANFSAAKDPCLQPHLRGMHGTFVEAFSMATSTQLFPFFSGSKLTVNNELLIPDAMYLSTETRYSGGNNHGGLWEGKKDKLIWRGTASGGRSQEHNWWHYQRHRFVQMLNGSSVALVEAGDEAAAPTFTLKAAASYHNASMTPAALGPWLGGWSDIGFNRLDCWPERHNWLGRLMPTCPYTDDFFSLVSSKPMAEQYSYKFLADVDGNSVSARWRGFLASTSCPLKATVYAEWHDDRLAPWLHFVPFDNTFVDIYAVMGYFLDGHDAEARRIAHEGHEWAKKVLRREDMMLYMWRLLLEYARVLDPLRDRLGFVDDLITDASR